MSTDVPAARRRARIAVALDPTVSPRAHLYQGLFWLVNLIGCRAFHLPPIALSVTWSPLGVGAFWLAPYLLRPGWRRDRRFHATITFILVSMFVTRIATEMPWAIAAWESWVDTVAMVVAMLTLKRLGRGRDDLLASGSDIHRATLSALAGALVCCALFLPVVLLTVEDRYAAYFYAIGAWANLCYGVVPGANLVSDFEPRVLRGLGMKRAFVVCGLAVGLLVLVSTPGTPAPVVGSIIIVVSVAYAAVCAVLEGILWLNFLGFSVAALSYFRRSPFGGESHFEQTLYVHIVMFLVCELTMATVLERKGRTELLADAEEQRRRAVDEARRARLNAAKVDAIVTTMSDGVLVLDTDGRVDLCNRAAGVFVGAEAGHDLPEWAADLVPDVQADPGGQHDDLEVPSDTAAGRPARTLSVRTAPLQGVPGSPIAVVLRDISDERRHMDELRTFARVAAHDLRQPLTAMTIWTEELETILGESVEDAHTQSALDHLRSSTVRMDRFLDDLTGYTLARDGRIEPTDIDVADLAQEIVDTCRRTTAADQQAEFVVQATHRVLGDRAMLRQVLDNLVGNAMKYVPAGASPRVEVSSYAEPGWVGIVVDDAGIGIPATEREAVFQEFYRSDAHRKDYPGTGLGLAICRRIVERHGGFLVADESPLGGTRMLLRLPA